MITEDYVSFEVAKLLKEKGFDEYCGYYSSDGKYWGYCVYNHRGKDYISAPTLQMAMKWLREEYKMHCDIGYDDLGWFWNILDIDNAVPVEERPKIIKNGFAGYNSYEEACEMAIKYCLENLFN